MPEEANNPHLGVAVPDLVSHTILLAPIGTRRAQSDGPPSPESHAVIDQSPAELDLHLFETAQAGVDVPASPLERARQHRRVSCGLGGGAGRMRADDECRVAEKTHAGG